MRSLFVALALIGLASASRAQNAINVTLSTSTSAGSTVTINPPSGSVTYDAANIYDNGTVWNRVRFPNTAEKIPTGDIPIDLCAKPSLGEFRRQQHHRAVECRHQHRIR
jgi:2-methylaconitate cis-trans-isomerase PrpF